MSTNKIISELDAEQMGKELPEFSPGDTVVVQVKVIEGLGATADVILANGTLKRGDRIVMCGFSGPVVTRVRELLTPRPLREIRVKTDYLHHDKIDVRCL